MNIDFERINMMLDIMIKAAKVGLAETSHVVAAVQDELRSIHTDLAEEKAKSAAALAEAKAKEDAAAAKANNVPIDSLPRDAAGNIISQPRAIPSTPPVDNAHVAPGSTPFPSTFVHPVEPDPNEPPPADSTSPNSPLRRP